MRNLSVFHVEKVRQATARASEKAVEKATAYLWKTARNSVKKTQGREKKYDLDMFLSARKQNGTLVGEKTMKVKDYLSRPNRQNEQVVIRDSMRNIRDPQEQGRYVTKTPSAGGQPPKSHKTVQPGWIDHWLKKGIRFDPKAGTVYLNPARIDRGGSGRSKTMPLLLEEGGEALSHVKILKGYFVHKTRYKNGKVTVSYTPNYTRKLKRYRMHARPFLVPAMKKAADQLLKILEGSIK